MRDEAYRVMRLLPSSCSLGWKCLVVTTDNGKNRVSERLACVCAGIGDVLSSFSFNTLHSRLCAALSFLTVLRRQGRIGSVRGCGKMRRTSMGCVLFDCLDRRCCRHGCNQLKLAADMRMNRIMNAFFW